MRDGLPQNSVYSIVQTPDGYIWLGTGEGVVRFDGVRFTVFDRSNTKGLRSNDAWVLMVGRDGALWIGTGGGGLTRFHGNWTTYTTRDGLLSNNILSLFEDRAGSIWIGSEQPGVNRLQDGRLTSYGVRDGLPFYVSTICDDGEGNLWLGSRGGGLARFREGKFLAFAHRDGLPDDKVNIIYKARDGSLRIGTPKGGLTQIREGRFSTEPIDSVESKLGASRMVEDRDGSLWVGTSSDGIRRLRHGSWEAYRTNDGLSDETVQSLFEDREGNLWIGTLGGGVNRLANGKFTTFGKAEGLSNNRVVSVFGDLNGAVWIGTLGGGLNRLADGKVTLFKEENGLPGNSVFSIWEDRESSLWLGGSKGLSRMKNGRIARCGAEVGLPTDPFCSVTGDRQGNVWIGSIDGGLYRFKDGRVTSYGKKDGLSSDYIFNLLEDHEGVLWVGTALGGLYRFENGRFTRDAAVNRLSQDGIESLYEDRQGSLWIGIREGGLGRLKAGHLTVCTKKEGLFDDSAFQILEDDQGYLWMGCDKGISRVRKSDFDDFAEGRIRSIPHTAYGPADGMRTAECNGAGQPSGWKGRDGRLWFATEGGVVVIDPARIALNPTPPPVLIEEVLVDDRIVDQRLGARLSPDARRIEIHYTALSFVAPSKVRFRYRLENFDKDWVEAGTRRVAYYTNLPPGTHRFRVIACNNDAVWNNEGATMEFTILPLFYQTTWFFLLCLASAGCLAWTGYQWRVHQMTGRLDLQFRERLSERTRIARELHDTLLQSFQGLMLQFQDARDFLPSQPREAIQSFDNALDQADQAITEGRNAIQDIRSSNSADADLGPAITALGNEVAASEGAGTSATFRVTVEGTPRALRPLLRDEIYRIAREALRNAFHHARASRIEADITYGDKLLRLRIRDNGTGIDPAVLDHGGRAGHWGLPGMRERARLVGVQLEVSSWQGAGTEINISARGSIAYEGSSGRSWFPFRRRPTEDQERHG